ncbi:MAG: hypothetical protein ACPGUV_08880, partial [Polyangiales bacterium]
VRVPSAAQAEGGRGEGRRNASLRPGKAGGGRQARWVGVGGNRQLAEFWAADLDVQLRTPVQPPQPVPGGWQLWDDRGAPLGHFTHVGVTAPAAQATALLAAAPALASAVAGIQHAPCLAALVCFAAPLPMAVDAVRTAGPLAWACREASKAGRSGSEACWVLHGSPAWSANALETPPAHFAQGLVDALGAALGQTLPQVKLLQGHRWRYAKTVHALGQPCLFDRDTALGYAGDGCLGDRIEDAFASGQALAEQLLSDVR